ncbi:hypothetical protein L914_17567 [Phytophthora nicotianae]|uniref:Uncharacterized protein n=1 Tax=Phytophthora nicotianae TaxID=4792 RepID=W2MIP5_PHYNI|nr:hypothetical protein L914_17567 [Phytophthora nicotianae]
MRHILAVGSDTFRHQAPLQLGSGQDDLDPVGNDVGRDDTELGPVGNDVGRGDTELGPIAVTLGSNTNNRIEASWKHLKDLVNSFMKVDGCIAAIMCYQDQQEQTFMNSLYKLTVAYNPKIDPEMQFLQDLLVNTPVNSCMSSTNMR